MLVPLYLRILAATRGQQDPSQMRAVTEATGRFLQAILPPDVLTSDAQFEVMVVMASSVCDLNLPADLTALSPTKLFIDAASCHCMAPGQHFHLPCSCLLLTPPVQLLHCLLPGALANSQSQSQTLLK